MRIAALWSQPSGYLDAALRALADAGHEVALNSFPTNSEAPFSADVFSWLTAKSHHCGLGESDALAELLGDFRPEVLLISGWNHPIYRNVSLKFRGDAVRVLCMDNPWKETPRQWLGRVMAPLHVKPYFDLASVPGERQYQFARRLGFAHGEIVPGLLACDVDKFAQARLSNPDRLDRFIYVGRLAEEKGVRLLAAAYSRYRSSFASAWDLTVAGAGPLAGLLEGVPGIHVLGFVQPTEVAALIAEHRVLLVPSRSESWGVQIHEGAAAGLAIICTSACGASAHLVREGFNGYIVETDDELAFADAMGAISSGQAQTMGAASPLLAAQMTPSIWAANLERAILRIQSRDRG